MCFSPIWRTVVSTHIAARRAFYSPGAYFKPPAGWKTPKWVPQIGGMRLETSSKFLGSTKPITGPISLVYALKQRGTVSSNSRFQAILFQQYSANLSNTGVTLVSGASLSQPRITNEARDCASRTRNTRSASVNVSMESGSPRRGTQEAHCLALFSKMLIYIYIYICI